MVDLTTNGDAKHRQTNLTPVLSSPVQTFVWTALIGVALLIAVGILLVTGQAGGAAPAKSVLVGALALAAASLWVGLQMQRDYPHTALGLGNLATFARLVIVAVLLVAVVGGVAPNWWTFALAIVGLSLDGIDGWLTRKQGLVSEFGAEFDVQVDAAFALILAMFAATNGTAGLYVVLLGLPYYVFTVAKRVWPWLGKPLPERFSRKAVCVFQISALIVLQVPFLAGGYLDPLVGLVILALAWSFGRDILWLRRTDG